MNEQELKRALLKLYASAVRGNSYGKVDVTLRNEIQKRINTGEFPDLYSKEYQNHPEKLEAIAAGKLVPQPQGPLYRKPESLIRPITYTGPQPGKRQPMTIRALRPGEEVPSAYGGAKNYQYSSPWEYFWGKPGQADLISNNLLGAPFVNFVVNASIVKANWTLSPKQKEAKLEELYDYYVFQSRGDDPVGVLARSYQEAVSSSLGGLATGHLGGKILAGLTPVAEAKPITYAIGFGAASIFGANTMLAAQEGSLKRLLGDDLYQKMLSRRMMNAAQHPGMAEGGKIQASVVTSRPGPASMGTRALNGTIAGISSLIQDSQDPTLDTRTKRGKAALNALLAAGLPGTTVAGETIKGPAETAGNTILSTIVPPPKQLTGPLPPEPAFRVKQGYAYTPPTAAQKQGQRLGASYVQTRNKAQEIHGNVKEDVGLARAAAQKKADQTRALVKAGAERTQAAARAKIQQGKDKAAAVRQAARDSVTRKQEAIDDGLHRTQAALRLARMRRNLGRQPSFRKPAPPASQPLKPMQTRPNQQKGNKRVSSNGLGELLHHALLEAELRRGLSTV